jgi:hypothetical protein
MGEPQRRGRELLTGDRRGRNRDSTAPLGHVSGKFRRDNPENDLKIVPARASEESKLEVHSVNIGNAEHGRRLLSITTTRCPAS